MPDAALQSTTENAAYHQLEEAFATLAALRGVMGILHWDAAVIMPEISAHARGEQMAGLSQIMHERMADPHMGQLLDEAEYKQAELDDTQQANLREMRRQWKHANAVDVALVKEMALVTSESEMAWRTARKNNDFAGFLPHLQKVMELVRTKAQQMGDALDLAPYDALMDTYDPDTRMVEVDAVFERLKQELPTLRTEAMAWQAENVTLQPLTAHYPVAKQHELAEFLARKLGFGGRLDVSTHPFCGGATGDVRITTRYNEADFMDALQGVLHETGHALYEQNRPQAWRNQPVGHARGMSTHESQSLLVEMQLCRSRAFLTFATPHIRQFLQADEPGINAENLYRIGTRVKPGLIRVRADEVCYPSHVIMRYELEKALISGALDVADLPDAWAAQMEEKLGITPQDDTNGCLQDIHWPGGQFGYFPTYTLGAMMAAQWFAALQRAVPDWEAQTEKGEFEAITGWLKQHVHEPASRYSRQELLKRATGEELNADIYLAHLKQRYVG